MIYTHVLNKGGRAVKSPLDRIELAKAPLPYEKLDQLTMEIIMGVR